MIDANQKKNATRFVLLTVFCYSMGFGIIMPVLPELIVELEGVSMSEATLIGGFIAASYAVFQFLMGPLVGNLGDRFGRRPVFLLSLAGYSVDFCLMGFAPSIIWLFVGRAVAGALGAIFGPANAAMADMSSGEDRAKGFGMVGAAFGIGFMIGPAIGGLLGDFGTRTPFFVAAGLSAFAFVYGYFAFPETMPESNRREFSFKRANPVGALLAVRKIPGVLGIAVIYFIWVTSTNIYPVSWAYFAPIRFGWDSKMIGLSLTLVGISMAFVQAMVLGRAVERFGERNTAMVGLSAAIIVMLFHAFNSNAILALSMSLVVGLQGMVMPSINAMMSRRTPPNSQGELQGFNGSLAALAALFAPLIYNSTLSYYTSQSAPVYFPGAAFLISSALAMVALVWLYLLKPSLPGSQQ
jgi:DHA1 family tetracycline resistance protein-like MFS transporter